MVQIEGVLQLVRQLVTRMGATCKAFILFAVMAPVLGVHYDTHGKKKEKEDRKIG